MRGGPVRRAGAVERALVGEVGVDGVPLDAGALGDPADRRPRGAEARVQLDGRLDDPLAGLLLAARPLLLLVLSIHCTSLYLES